MNLPNMDGALGECVSNGKYSQAFLINKDKMHINIFSTFLGLKEK